MPKNKTTSEEKYYASFMQYLDFNFLLSIVNEVIKSKICPETTADEWIKTLSYMHRRGWLYYSYEEGKIVVILGAYQIKEFDENKPIELDSLPDKSEGKILYVPFVVSKAKDNIAFKRMLNNYLKEHEEVEELIFYERNSDKKFKRFKLNQGDNKDVKTESTYSSEAKDSARVPGRL